MRILYIFFMLFLCLPSCIGAEQEPFYKPNPDLETKAEYPFVTCQKTKNEQGMFTTMQTIRTLPEGYTVISWLDYCNTHPMDVLLSGSHIVGCGVFTAAFFLSTLEELSACISPYNVAWTAFLALSCYATACLGFKTLEDLHTARQNIIIKQQ